MNMDVKGDTLPATLVVLLAIQRELVASCLQHVR